MSTFDSESTQLKHDLLEMALLVRTQLEKSREALLQYDTDLASEIIANDKRVNVMELKIDKYCERILALYSPVATDLRFVLASLKINHALERIGDHAEGIGWYVIETGRKIEQELIDRFTVVPMYDKAISMLDNIYEALENEDTVLARKIFKKDDFLNKKNKKATKTAIKILKESPEKTKMIIPLLSIVRKIERVGDLTKNMGEEIIFHIEAKVLKHKKKEKNKKDEAKDKDKE